MATVEEFVEVIKSGSERRFKQMLEDDPGIAQTKVDSYHGCTAPQLAMYLAQEDFAWSLYRLVPEPDFATACTVGDLDRFKELLSADSTLIEKLSDDGYTPLCLAAACGHLRLVTYLLEEGADPNAPSRAQGGVRPLGSAVAGKKQDIARILLEFGADPNLQRAGGIRPIHDVAQMGNQPMLLELVTHGADVRARTETGDTPLSLARRYGHHDLALYIEQNFGGM